MLNATFRDKFVREEKAPAFGIFCFIDDVKINIIRHPHPLTRRQLIIDNIRMLSTENIIAMKVQAILGRGKKKDFWDVAELLQHFTIAGFFKFYKEKFAAQNLLITVPRAPTYFADAHESEDSISSKSRHGPMFKKLSKQKGGSILNKIAYSNQTFFSVILYKPEWFTKHIASLNIKINLFCK